MLAFSANWLVPPNTGLIRMVWGMPRMLQHSAMHRNSKKLNDAVLRQSRTENFPEGDILQKFWTLSCNWNTSGDGLKAPCRKHIAAQAGKPNSRGWLYRMGHSASQVYTDRAEHFNKQPRVWQASPIFRANSLEQDNIAPTVCKQQWVVSGVSSGEMGFQSWAQPASCIGFGLCMCCSWMLPIQHLWSQLQWVLMPLMRSGIGQGTLTL